MDNSQYHPGAMSSSNSSYPPLTGSALPNISPHQLQQNHSNMSAHNTTLPPLQGTQQAHASMHNMYGGGSAPHTPRTPATPGTPNSANTMGNFPQQMGGQSRGYQMMPGNYQQPAQQYRTSSSMLPQSTTSMAPHQPLIAPAPAQGRMNQPPLRPMPPNSMQMGGMSAGYGQAPMMMPHEMEPPTHVVGSQGRRGILPSAPGRPPVPQTAGGKTTMIPAKDADGKFPCPHCTKTYLHAKHLKRHLLRHTGDRPYMCVLCRDTFSRSDILKRHFQKCSIRRGNPTGASHLSHAQAHLKKNHKNSPSMSNPNDMMGMNGMNNMNHGMNNGMHNGMNNGMNSMPNGMAFGVDPNGQIPDAGSNMTNEQAEQLQRNDGLKHLNMGDGGDRRNMTGPSPSSRASFEQQSYAATMPPGMNPSLAFSMPNGQNGHSYYTQGYDYASHGNGSTHPNSTAGSRHGWPNVYQSTAPGGFANQFNPNTQNSQVSIKAEPGSFPNNYTNTTAPSQSPHANPFQDPSQDVSARLISFCFPPKAILSARENALRQYFSANYIRQFLELFNNFQVHFPTIHFPSFQRASAYEGLLLGMICIGAVYSDNISPAEVRDLMEFAKGVIERSSTNFSGMANVSNPNPQLPASIGSSNVDLQEIHAHLLMHILFTWNGTPVQREQARQKFPTLVHLAKKMDMLRPATSSILHQPGLVNLNPNNFDWNLWVEQEKRSRLMFALYLADTASVIYFNSSPLLDPLEIRLPLPADDAAWEASTAQECGNALGIYGQAIAQAKYSDGSRQLKQPEMHTALRTLMHQVYDLQPGTTNSYSKFILVHALNVQLWSVQKQLSQEPGHVAQQTVAFSSGPPTPISQQDLTHSAPTSGRATPVDGHSSQMLKITSNALAKWKKAWDNDMNEQYPPLTSSRRMGFCRDAVPFYWLATSLLKHSRGVEWQMAPDQRFTYVMRVLEGVKAWSISDSAQRGQEPGSVSEIDMNYGTKDLNLDMSLLFKPINKHQNSPRRGVHTITGNGTS